MVGADAGAHFAALEELKRQHPQLRTLISIGGWEAGGFSDAALSADSRKRFVDSCIALFFEQHRGSFDGVDIDWEFPVYGGPPEIAARPQDRHNMTLLAQEFRRQLDSLGKPRGQAAAADRGAAGRAHAIGRRLRPGAQLRAGDAGQDARFHQPDDLRHGHRVLHGVHLQRTAARRSRRPARSRRCAAGTTSKARSTITASTACPPTSWCWACRSMGAASV